LSPRHGQVRAVGAIKKYWSDQTPHLDVSRRFSTEDVVKPVFKIVQDAVQSSRPKKAVTRIDAKADNHRASVTSKIFFGLEYFAVYGERTKFPEVHALSLCSSSSAFVVDRMQFNSETNLVMKDFQPGVVIAT
jgi:hypothetical protein